MQISCCFAHIYVIITPPSEGFELVCLSVGLFVCKKVYIIPMKISGKVQGGPELIPENFN